MAIIKPFVLIIIIIVMAAFAAPTGGQTCTIDGGGIQCSSGRDGLSCTNDCNRSLKDQKIPPPTRVVNGMCRNDPHPGECRCALSGPFCKGKPPAQLGY